MFHCRAFLACLVLWTMVTAATAARGQGADAEEDVATAETPSDAAAACVKGAARSAVAPMEAEAEWDPLNKAAGGTGMGVVERGRERELVTESFSGDLSKAANSTGNPNGSCNQLTSGINGYPSLFYKVTGGDGRTVTADKCRLSPFFQSFYVWEGNGTCASFNCTPANTAVCSLPNSAVTSWTAQTGAEYYVQVYGITGFGGTYTVTFSSDAPIEVSEANVCGTSHPRALTFAPTDAPTDVPTDAPTKAPTVPPSLAPTEFPTEAPTELPTKAPTVVDPCAGVVTTHWLYDPKTNAPIRKLVNNSATCLLHPYNIQVSPCNAIGAKPIRVRLLDATGGPPLVVYKSKPQRSAPYFLFGPAPTKGDVLPSPKPLPNGVYYLAAKGAPEWGRLQFTQKCPCPDGTKKGKKGCMK